MACNLLTIHVPTVPSESAFNVEGYIIIQYGTRLDIYMVHVVMCLRDW